MKRLSLWLLLVALGGSSAFGGQSQRILDQVHHHTRAALRALGREIDSWMATMNRQLRGARDGVARSVQEVKTAGRQAVASIEEGVAVARTSAVREMHKALSGVTQEFVPIGTRPEVRVRVAEPTPVTSPILEPLFLKQRDIILAWRIELNRRATRRSLLLDDRLLLEDAAADVYSLDPHRGMPQWVCPLPGPSQYLYRADKDTIVLIASDILFQIDRLLGRARDRYILPFPTSCAPALHGDSIILASVDDRIYSLDRKTHVKEWTYLATGHIEAGLATAINNVFVAQSDGKVYAHVPGQRRPRWEYQCHDAVRVPLVVQGDNLYFPADDLYVHCYNWTAGFRAWRFPVRGPVTQPIWPDGDTVYFAAEGDGFYAVARVKGKKLWHVPGARWPVAVGNKNIYLEGPQQSLLCLERATGKMQWRVDAAPFSYFVRNTQTDYIYLATPVGQVYAFYLRGDHLEEKKPPAPPPVRPPEGPAAPQVAPPPPPPAPAPAPATAPPRPARQQEEEEEF